MGSDIVIPRYQKVKNYVLQQIASGHWKASDKIPSEQDLVRRLKMSRMTINRGLRELADDGFIVRVAGIGTFVADRRAHGHPLSIKNIADEIRERQHSHSAVVLELAEKKADEEISAAFNIVKGRKLFFSAIIHRENELPIQLEQRYVNPVIGPDYLKQDFSAHTPYEYLMHVAPLQAVEHTVQAVMPDRDIRRFLCMNAREPCLLIERRTWSQGTVATFSKLYHPGSRYYLSGEFKPHGEIVTQA